jgi:hypothetical protein
MRLRNLGARLSAFVLGVLAAASTHAQQPPLQQLEITDHVRIRLQQLPYYGPYDIIGFTVKGSTVTLNGWVYQAMNKDEAEAAVRRVQGVTNVVDDIQVLPVSISDDKIRREVFRAIYSDDFLQKYGTPIPGIDGARWGRRFWGRGLRGFGSQGSGFGNFPGSEPVGNYAIHIVVKGGQVGLYGTVNSEVDKTKAGMDVRGVFGVLGVDNQLQVVTD